MSAQLVTFTLAGHTYGVPVEVVQEVLRGLPRTRVPLAPATTAGLINLRGQVLTAVELRLALGLLPYPDGSDAPEQMLVVVRQGGESTALVVDAIGAVVEADADLFEPPPDTLDAATRALVVGAYTFPDHLLLALDVGRALAA